MSRELVERSNGRRGKFATLRIYVVRRSWFDKLTTNGELDKLTTNGELDKLTTNGDRRLCFLMSFWVYILRCRDDSYYTGHTDNLEHRVEQHKSRAFPTCYTATRLPVELVFVQELATRAEALASERQIKGWGRKKKEAMMRGDWNEVSRLAQNTLRQAQGERPTPQDESLFTVRGELVEPHAVNKSHKV